MKKYLFLSLVLWILISACNDPVLVGSDLLSEDALDVGFTDTTTIIAATALGDPSLTYRNVGSGTFPNTNYMVGVMDDPVFGRSEAISYFTPTLIATYPELTDTNLDSVVITIQLDTLGFYGDVSAIHNMELRLLSEELVIERDSTLESDLRLDTRTEVFGSFSLVVSPTDSLWINPYTFNNPDTLVEVGPQLRLALDKNFWVDIQSATDSITNESLLELVPGFALSSDPSSSSMIGLNLLYNVNGPANINFYYRANETDRSTYRIPLGNIRHSNFTQDYSSSELGLAMENDDSDRLYIQSQAGTDITLDLSAVRNLDDRILNKAELQLFIDSEDENLYPPIEGLFAWLENAEGELEAVAGPSSTSSPITEVFINGENKLSYTLDLTDHLDLILKDTSNELNNTIRLIASSKVQRPNRSIIYGPEHPEFPLKLNLILTKP